MQVQTSRWTSRWAMPLLVAAGFALAWAIPRYELINPYYDLILMYIGINIILTVSLNLVNGYMGEFSDGHAGFMTEGAYVAKVLTTGAMPWDMEASHFRQARDLAGRPPGI